MPELKPKTTTAAAEDVATAFKAAADAAGLEPTAELLAVLLAQSALETGHWSAMYNFNFGNVKASDKWIGGGGSYTFYDKKPAHAEAPVTENLSADAVKYWLARAKLRTDGGDGLDMVVGRQRGDGRFYCLFWPSHQQARFRAFETLEAGAAAFLSKLTGRYRPALKPAAAGNVAGYVNLIHSLGPYFTASIDDWTDSKGRQRLGYRSQVQSLYRKYLHVARAAMPAPTTPKRTTMKTLVYLIHADPSQDPKYVNAASEAGVDIELHNVTLGNGSSVYRQLARDVGTLEGFLRRYPPRCAHDALVIATFSAGYGFPAELLKLDPAAADQIDGLVFIDSHHAGLDADKTAKDADLSGVLLMAQRATAGPVVCWLGHTDVPTVGYASTTQVADELARLTGLEFVQQQAVNRQGAVRIAEIGGLRIEGYNQVGPAGTKHSWSQAQLEHGRALTTWGPPFLARALVELASRTAIPGDTPAPVEPETDVPTHDRSDLDQDLSHGDRAVAWALARVGTAEQPIGSNRGPEVSAWLKPSQRDGYGPEFGQWLASSGANWCAAFSCAAQAATRLPGDPPAMHAYRCSGIELENDAKAAGAWVSIADVLYGGAGWRPRAGDIAIYKSGSQAWRRHIVLVAETEGAESFRGIGGNEGNRVTDAGGRRFDAQQLLGFVELPRVEKLAGNWAPLKRAVELEQQLWQGVVGMDAYEELLAELQEADPRDDGEEVLC